MFPPSHEPAASAGGYHNKQVQTQKIAQTPFAATRWLRVKPGLAKANLVSVEIDAIRDLYRAWSIAFWAPDVKFWAISGNVRIVMRREQRLLPPVTIGDFSNAGLAPDTPVPARTDVACTGQGTTHSLVAIAPIARALRSASLPFRQTLLIELADGWMQQPE
jgi:hypothetical protein